MLPLPPQKEALHVEIWVESLLPDGYGPLAYLIWEDERWSGHIFVVSTRARVLGTG